MHPERVSAEVDGHAAIKARAKERYWSYLEDIDGRSADGPWIMGERFTVADPYALPVWCGMVGCRPYRQSSSGSNV